MIRPLKPPDLIHLRAAEGWLELGDWQSANDELEQISPVMRAHPRVLHVRHDVYATAKKWELAVEVARALSVLVSDDPFGFIHHAFALHELHRTQEAWDFLRPVADRFPNEWLISYNLACYASRLGNLPRARELLKKAIQIAGDKSVKILALEDPDLEPLWNQMRDA